MLKLRDFVHLPQLDSLVAQLVAEDSGLIVLAGIDARQPGTRGEAAFTPSGLSAIFNILMQEILLANPLTQAVVIAEERSLAKVPRQISRRVRLLKVDERGSYTQQIDIATHQRPGLIVIERLCEETAPAAVRAAGQGLRVLAQLDTVMRGADVAHHLLDLGVPRDQLSALRWVLTNQRMPVLCSSCKQPVETSAEMYERVREHYPHLHPVIERLRQPPEPGHTRRKSAAPRPQFYRAGSCEVCHGTGYQGDMAVFDLFRNDPHQADFFTQSSLISLEEYALHLAAQGDLDLDDLLGLERDHLRRTYQMLTASERALSESNSELQRKLLELETSNRVLLQRTEVLMSLQNLGQALISSTDLKDLAARICRQASEVSGANRVVLYLHRQAENDAERAEILAVRGWDAGLVGKQLDLKDIYDPRGEVRTVAYKHIPPGILEAGAQEGSGARIQMGMRVPLLAQKQQVGVMIVESTQKEFFTPGETALLQTFANQAALAMQRAGLVDDLRAKIDQLEAAQSELVKKERLERELELARQVQQNMLPQHFPEVPGYAFSAQNEPARQVGGDFYDILVLDEDHFGIVIADVADKGMPAALYMALTRSLLLAEAQRELSPRQALLNINHLLLQLGDLNGFVSVFYGVVACSTRRLTYTRAGHERPLLLRDGQTLRLGGSGTVLGILEGEELNLSEEEEDLRAGDRLVLYTDGLTDVLDVAGQFSGLTRLEAILQAQTDLPAAKICEMVFAELANFRGQAEQFDDMTLLVLEVEEN